MSLQSYTEMKRSLDRLNKFLNIDVLEVFTSWIGGEVAIIKPRLENDQKADHIVLAIRAKEIHLAKDQMAYLAEQIQWRDSYPGESRWSLTVTRFIISD